MKKNEILKEEETVCNISEPNLNFSKKNKSEELQVIKIENLKISKKYKTFLNFRTLSVIIIFSFLILHFSILISIQKLRNNMDDKLFKAQYFAKQSKNKIETLEELLFKEKHLKQGNESDLRVALITIGKHENRYAIEFIDYYLKLGVDKIFIVDNNIEEKEKFQNVLQDYVQKGVVEIFNNGSKYIDYKTQNLINENLFHEYKDKFDWMLLFDFDEFLYVKSGNLKYQLNKSKYDNCEVIKVNWLPYGDGGNLYYEDKPVLKRFTVASYNTYLNQHTKLIIRTTIPKLKLSTIHSTTDLIKNVCDETGSLIPLNVRYKHIYNRIYYDEMYLKHFYTKSTEEFCDKYLNSRQYWIKGQSVEKSVGFYFDLNAPTIERIKIIEKTLNINLDKYRNELTS